MVGVQSRAFRGTSRRIRRVATLVAVASAGGPPSLASDHFNLENGIPTSLEDIEPTERGAIEVQTFVRYLRLTGARDDDEAELRLAWGIIDQTQLEIAAPLQLGAEGTNGNGDVRAELLRRLWRDRPDAWWPGVALAAEVRLPTGVAAPGFANRTDAGVTAIAKKDFGSHSFHLNAGVEWTRDRSADEQLRSVAFGVIAGHDMPLTESLLLVSDVLWHQADDQTVSDVWMFETGVRAQVSRAVIGAVGLGVGLDRGEETAIGSLTAGLQCSL